MKGGVLAFFAGAAIAFGFAAIATKGFAPHVAAGLGTLDLNKADAEAFRVLGISPELAERIIENRPYRSKIELLERYVVGKADFDLIKNRVSLDGKHAHDAVVVAS